MKAQQDRQNQGHDEQRENTKAAGGIKRHNGIYNFPSTFFNDFWEQWEAERVYQEIVEEHVQM